MSILVGLLRVMLTNDVDFLMLAARRAEQQQRLAPIFFWPQQRRSIGQLVRSLIHEASVMIIILLAPRYSFCDITSFMQRALRKQAS